MIGIDTNILFHSLNPKSGNHLSALRFLTETFASERVVLTDYVLVELYNLLRNPAVMSLPLSPIEAAQTVGKYLKFPTVIWAENAPVMNQIWKLAAEPDFPRRRIFDLRLALTLRHHGATRFATANIKDFKDLGFDQVWNPLLEI